MNQKLCVVCHEKQSINDIIRCRNNHFTCRMCLENWYKRAPSKTGQCPACFVFLAEFGFKVENFVSVSYVPDHLTLNWLNSHTKRCPNCKHGIEKIGGCNTVKCICGTSFCYTCETTSSNICRCKSQSQIMLICILLLMSIFLFYHLILHYN